MRHVPFRPQTRCRGCCIRHRKGVRGRREREKTVRKRMHPTGRYTCAYATRLDDADAEADADAVAAAAARAQIFIRASCTFSLSNLRDSPPCSRIIYERLEIPEVEDRRSHPTFPFPVMKLLSTATIGCLRASFSSYFVARTFIAQ